MQSQDGEQNGGTSPEAISQPPTPSALSGSPSGAPTLITPAAAPSASGPRVPTRRTLSAIAVGALAVIIVGVSAAVGVGHGWLGGTTSRASVAATTPTAIPSPTLAPIPPGNDWAQYRFDLQGTGVNPETQITVNNVASLVTHWAVHTSAAFESTPALVDGVVYVTDGNSLYAFDLRTSAQLWRFNALPQQISTVSSSVAIDPTLHLAFYGNPDARVYAVDTRTGAGVWNVQLSTAKGAFVWSSPLVVNGKVYVGIASHDDNPCVRGAVFALDEQSGAIDWTHYTVPAGALGGTVWSSLIANAGQHELIATTGNPCPEGPSFAQTDSILGLDWDTGATRWQYQVLPYDECDCDFGEGAVDVVYQGQEYIIAGNKYGAVYALTRSPTGGTPHLAWSKRISGAGFLGQGGVFEPPTYDNGLVFVGGGPTLDGACRQGGLWALQVNTGQVAWRACTSGQLVSPAALTNGVLFVPQQDHLVAYEASSGRVLKTLSQPGAAWGGVAISHGIVLDATVSNTLYCYTLPSTFGG